LDRITIFSIREHPVPSEEFLINNCRLSIKYLSPKFIEIGEGKKKTIIRQKGVFPVIPGIIEKFLSGKKLCNELKKLYKKTPYDYVHLLDNFGFTNRLIAKNIPTPVSVSAMSYQGKCKIIYDNYLRLSYKVPNLKVIPYSFTYAKKMKQIGIPENNIKCIRWGVKMPSIRQTEENKRKAKKLLSLPVEKPLFVWAGYIQQIQKKDFLYAFKLAKKALSKGIKCTFFFAFKPGVSKKNITSFDNPTKGMFIKNTTIEEFDLLKQAADVFYSPVVNKNCIVAPPLTWIEFLSSEVPILTTNAGGVDEIVVNGKTGYVAKTDSELLNKMFIIAKNYSTMSPHCYEKTSTLYNIKDIAKEYLNLWYSEKY